MAHEVKLRLHTKVVASKDVAHTTNGRLTAALADHQPSAVGSVGAADAAVGRQRVLWTYCRR